MSSDVYRVLVVDDDPDIAEYTRTVLERRGGFQARVLNDPLRTSGPMSSSPTSRCRE
jgi:CheY-like chemotaxis protein